MKFSSQTLRCKLAASRPRRLTGSRLTRPIRSRAAFTLMELTLALGLAGVVSVSLTPVLVGVTHQRQELFYEHQALTELSNVLDDLTKVDPRGLPSSIERWRSHIADDSGLPHAELTVSTVPDADRRFGVQVRCRLAWADARGHKTASLSLIGWNFRAAGDQL